VDDDLGLLPDQQDPAPPRRPVGLLIGALVVVALVAVAGVVWMVASVADRGGKAAVAGSASPAPAPTPAPTTAAIATVPPTTAAPTTTAPTTTAAPTSATPARSAATVVATTPPPAPRPSPKPTTAPVPTPRPVPKPTLTVPVGKLVRVPDVVGLKVQQASAVLRAAGLKVQVIGGVLDPDRDDRRITTQRPAAGTSVLAGSTVILVTDGT
jgi:hypothetical protein